MSVGNRREVSFTLNTSSLRYNLIKMYVRARFFHLFPFLNKYMRSSYVQNTLNNKWIRIRSWTIKRINDQNNKLKTTNELKCSHLLRSGYWLALLCVGYCTSHIPIQFFPKRFNIWILIFVFVSYFSFI